MSANESTPAVSLREARQREAMAVTHAVNVQHNPHATATAFHSASERAVAARRATDEALVRAVLRYIGDWMAAPNAEGFAPYTRAASAVLDAVEAGGGGTMTTLPEAVEQAIHAADETNTRIAEAANGSDLTDLYTEWREALTALRAAILAYGAARERQGIERAAAVPSTMAAERQAMVDQRRQRFDRDDGLTLQIESEGHTMAGLAKAIRALPVDGATP